MPTRTSLHLPVVVAGSEYLVMGYLMRRNILTYKAPPINEGSDLICIHPDPRHQPGPDERAQVRVQVKSRYGSDERSFPVKQASLDAFDFLVAAFLNIGLFKGHYDGTTGQREPEFYTLPQHFVWVHHAASGGWEKVDLRGLEDEIAQYKGEEGFNQIADALGITPPRRPPTLTGAGQEAS